MLIVVAGMEGALPSVVAGLVDKPVIAVPTSVGYGASFGGMAALLGMLNICASGVTVVNIDNGFGAALAATLINRVGIERDAALMAKRTSITSGRARRAIKMGELASQVGSSYLWNSTAAAVSQRARARSRAARDPHPQRAANRRRLARNFAARS